MTSKEMLVAAIKTAGTSQAKAAQAIGWVPQQLSSRLTRGSLGADEFLSLLEAIGVDITLKVKATDREVKVHRVEGAGRRVRCSVDRVIYDTQNSDALANNFYADGINEYNEGKALELYIDNEGRYFFAEYSEWDGVKDRITPVSAEVAASFISKYGTQIHKEKQN